MYLIKKVQKSYNLENCGSIIDKHYWDPTPNSPLIIVLALTNTERVRTGGVGESGCHLELQQMGIRLRLLPAPTPNYCLLPNPSPLGTSRL